MSYQDHYNGGTNWQRTREQRLSAADLQRKAARRGQRIALNRAPECDPEPVDVGQWIPIDPALSAYLGQAAETLEDDLPFGQWEDVPDPVWPVVPDDFDLSYSRVKPCHEGIDDEF